MKLIGAPLSVSISIISLIVGLMAGYYISPTYQQTMFSGEQMGLGQADQFVDLRYIDKMAAHHQAAILLAEQIEGKSQRPEIAKLAANIQAEEPKLINELYQWKTDWYKDSRRVKNPIVPNLGNADEKIDLRFLNALIAHHEGGIVMTKEIRTKSSRTEILDNADSVENFLQNSLITLRTWRELWFGVK